MGTSLLPTLTRRDRHMGLQIIGKEKRSKVRDAPLAGNKDERAMPRGTVIWGRMPEFWLHLNPDVLE